MAAASLEDASPAEVQAAILAQLDGGPRQREAIAFLYSLGLPIVLAYGTLDGAEDSTVRNYLDNLNHYDIVELDRALERAFALARR